MAKQIAFKSQHLEITSKTVVLHFHEESTVIPFSEITSYDLKWHLHCPTFGKKWWFLVLTVELKNGEEESGPVAFVKFNYVRDDHERRRCIEGEIVDALNGAISRPGVTQEMNCF